MDSIFLIPLVVLIVVATVVGLWRFSKHGTKSAVTAVVRVIVYGSLIFIALVILSGVIYYAGGGH
jgi:hypothetical protein